MSGNRAKDIAPPPPPPENQEKTVKVYFGIFFDGTKNNREEAKKGENFRKYIEQGKTEAEAKELSGYTGKANAKSIIPLAKLAGSSQEDDQSNVSLLQPFFKKTSSSDIFLNSVYIEGIGTDKDGKLYMKGLASGTGKQGIKEKVKDTIKSRVPVRINSLSIPNGSNIELYFELFGFSRGAAAARHCVWSALEDQRKTLKDELRKIKSLTLTDVNVDYVGLFDTVSSEGLNFSNDVKDLNLKIEKASYVFQICAADEFRENFALTNLKKTSSSKLEIFLPGDHCDIGGAHPAGEYEVTLYTSSVKDENDKITAPSVESLKHLGWIRNKTDANGKETPDNYSVTEPYYYTSYNPQFPGGYWVLGTITFRNKQKKGYSYISLTLMAEKANKEAKKELLDLDKIMRERPISPTLSEIKNKAMSSTTLEKCAETFSNYKKELRKDWLYFSSSISFVNSPNEENGIYKRINYDG